MRKSMNGNSSIAIRASIVAVVLALEVSAAAAQNLKYPEAGKAEQVDAYHGVKVADPYRWLEDDRSEETALWVKAENELTFTYLDKIPYRAQVMNRLEQLYNYPKYTAPFRRGEVYIFSKKDGLQNQDVLYLQKGLEGTPELLLHPNKFSAPGTAPLRAFEDSQHPQH